MTREQAMQQAKKAVFDATELFETLDKEGRLSMSGREVREGLSEHVAEFVKEHWISFDEQPANKVHIEDNDGDE